jgi:alpha-L-arabinofuranosidase
MNPDHITTLVDEHFYETADWFYFNTNRYDNYDRNMQADVFLGEYAAKANTLNAALAEAAFMTGLERNADVVKMACYAPLFGNSTLSQWTPDMIFFSNNSLMLTPNYYVQQLFANNVGVNILPSTLEVGEIVTGDSFGGKVGLGSWATSVSYDDLKVVSNADGSVLYECDFSSDSVLTDDNWEKLKGKWAISNGTLVQSSTATPSTNYGDVMYVGDTSWSNYTLTVKGTILNGNEGFLIPICVDDKNNNIFWNLGGWNNTVSCLEIIDGAVESGQVSGTVRNAHLNKNQEYEIKIVVEDTRIRCYLNDRLYIDYEPLTPEPLFETASIDANGDIILKFVNTTSTTIDINVALSNINLSQYSSSASVTTLSSENLTDTNSFENPDLIIPVASTLTVDSTFLYEAPGYSVSIIRIPHN